MARGHHVRVCTGKDAKNGHKLYKAGEGLVERVHPDDWQDSKAWADLILVSDNTKWLKELDVFKRQGYPVMAPSYESAQLELDREAGQKLLEKVGVNVIPYELFSDAKAAEKFIITSPARYVSKPNGDAVKALSYVSKSPRDMIFMLRRWNDTNKIKAEFLIQEYVGGVEFAVGGWMGPQGFAEYVCENFEHKKLMNDDKGPNTGEMGTALKYIRMKDSKLAMEVLKPCEKALRKLGHTGFVDVSVKVDEQGSPRPMEFTCRPGWPLFNFQNRVHPESIEWMVDLLNGNDTFKPSEDIVVGVAVCMPPFPYDGKEIGREVEGIPMYGLNDDNEYRECLHPAELMHGQAPDDDGRDYSCLVSSGDYLFEATGVAKTVQMARQRAYDAVDSVEIPNSPEYRTDIGARLEEDIEELKKHGYAESWTF